MILHFVLPVAELVLFDFVCLGAAIATITRWVANTFLKPATSLAFAVDQDVEWAFAFDIHCNGFLPVFVALHAAQFVLYPLLSSASFLAALASNALYALAFGYYFYITFLGYNGSCLRALIGLEYGGIRCMRVQSHEFVPSSCFQFPVLRFSISLTHVYISCSFFQSALCAMAAALPFLRDTQYFLFPVLPIGVLCVLAVALRFNLTVFVVSCYFP